VFTGPAFSGDRFEAVCVHCVVGCVQTSAEADVYRGRAETARIRVQAADEGTAI